MGTKVRENPARSKKHGYYCELKIDGLAIELIYKKAGWTLVQLAGTELLEKMLPKILKQWMPYLLF